jgi:hypothetical protein
LPNSPIEWGTQLPGFKATATNIERMGVYGDPTPNMEMFARLLNALFEEHLRIPLNAEDATMVMVLVKIMREKRSDYSQSYDDNRVDVAGWINILHQVIERHANP